MFNERGRLLPDGITPELLDETRTTFQPFYNETLSDDECIEMIVNVFALYDILFADDVKPPPDATGQSGR